MILFRISRESFLPYLAVSFILGILFGMIYDVFRIRRVAFRCRERGRAARIVENVIIFFEDTVFLLFVTVCLILTCYKTYFGIPRWYSYAAAALGFYIYYKTVGALVMKLSNKIISLIASALDFVRSRVIVPIIRAIKGAFLRVYRVFEVRLSKKRTKRFEKRVIRSLKGF